MIFWVISALALLGALGLGYGLGRSGRARTALSLASLAVIALAALLFYADSLTGWDGLGIAVISMVGLGPCIPGLGIGALLGWLHLQRREC